MELTRAPGSSAALGLCARRSWEPVRFTDRVKASKDCEEDATCRAPARPAAAVKSATEKRGRTPARSTETPACCFARLRAADIGALFSATVRLARPTFRLSSALAARS